MDANCSLFVFVSICDHRADFIHNVFGASWFLLLSLVQTRARVFLLDSVFRLRHHPAARKTTKALDWFEGQSVGGRYASELPQL